MNTNDALQSVFDVIENERQRTGYYNKLTIPSTISRPAKYNVGDIVVLKENTHFMYRGFPGKTVKIISVIGNSYDVIIEPDGDLICHQVFDEKVSHLVSKAKLSKITKPAFDKIITGCGTIKEKIERVAIKFNLYIYKTIETRYPPFKDELQVALHGLHRKSDIEDLKELLEVK